MKISFEWARLKNALRRRLARNLSKRPFRLRSARPLISFTFDDFPRSALLVGGTILEKQGARGTFYVALGLVGQTIATGEMFNAEDVTQVLERGHELGCHTFHHDPAWETPTANYMSSVERNAAALAALPRAIRPDTHSYPISYPLPATKRQLGRRFRGCRFGGQTFNQGVVDLNYLSSFFIEQCGDDFGAIERVIAANAEHKGWLIFSTHDVAENHTRFGCSPARFEDVVRAARASGAEIVTMSRALNELDVPKLREFRS